MELTTTLAHENIARHNFDRAGHYPLCYLYAVYQLSPRENVARHNTYRAAHYPLRYHYAMHQLSPRANAGERKFNFAAEFR